MNENRTSKREWVKTAAIIFLSVMLVLTFFSQSIMNYSLPEVATNYVQSGTITAKIRGTGVVESGNPYEVKITEPRKVSGVAVRVGDEVKKGDVLFYLEDAESEPLKEARKALEEAEKAYEQELLNPEISADNITSAEKELEIAVYRQQITKAQAALEQAKKAKEAADDVLKAAEAAVKPHQEKVNQIQQIVSAYQNQANHERNDDVAKRSQARVDAAKTAYEAAKAVLDAANEALKKAQNALNAASASGNDTAPYQANVNSAQAAVTAAKAEHDSKYSEYRAALNSDAERETAGTNLAASAADWELEKANAENALSAAKAVVEQKKVERDEAVAEVDKQKEELTLLAGSIGNVKKLEDLQDKITDAQEQVDELLAKAVDATVTADISGTVSAISATAGETVQAQATLMTLQPEGAAYTLSFSVTNEQAKRLAVGDRADLVNAWRYEDVQVTLASIKPDKEDPGQKKKLTFNVTGQISAGQTFNISVGQKSANFDLIVPNSAIREDTNGKFILIVESKSSPLGNRYVASRVDVEVLASDDTQSAVSGALMGHEYVITTSNKPVEAGKLVRLAEN